MAGSPGETRSQGATRAENAAQGPDAPGQESAMSPPASMGGAMASETRPSSPGTGEALPPGTLEQLVAENLGWLQGWLRGRVDDWELIHDVSQDSFLKAF